MKTFLTKPIVISGMLLFLQTIFAQSVLEKRLIPEDYDKWSTLMQENLSPNGEWIAYKLRYNSGKDTAFVRNTASTKQYCYPDGNNIVFSENNQWLTVNQKNNILLQNLITGEQKKIDNVIKSDFIQGGKLLVLSIKNSITENILILNLINKTDHKLQGVKEYTISPDKKYIGYIKHDNTVGLVWWSGDFLEKKVLNANELVRKNLVWNDTSNTIAFLEEIQINDSFDANHKIYFFKNVQGAEEMYSFNPTDKQDTLAGKIILYNPSFTPLLISPDNKKVFFYIKGDGYNPKEKNDVEIWNSRDKLEFKRNILDGSPASRPKLVVWYPELNKTFEINNNSHPSVYLTPDRNKAIVFDPHQYEPQEEIMSPSDLWITDLSTEKSSLIIEKQSRKMGRLGVSPNSRFLNYYKNKNWWIFDIDTGKHTIISANLNDLEDISADRGGEQPSYGCAGWSSDSKYLILYTRFDVWLITVDGKIQKRLTNGKPDSICYRVCSNINGVLQTYKFYDIIGANFNLKEGLILEAFDVKSKSSGFYKWSLGGKITKMIFKNAKLNRIKKASQKDSFILIEQKTNVSPQIILLDNSLKEKVLVKTNTQQNKFNWTKSELIFYKNSQGRDLQGVLHFPANYQFGKKYPMIVYIYEDQSHLLHHYYNPSLYTSGGFSPANFTTDDYFVFYPDIVYKEGEPGYSALDCVESSVREILNKGLVDKNRIGLIGHSFGGYEVSFIVTQSNLFSAAVAGAACTDLVAHSLTVEAGTGRSQMWRYQTHQLRMGKSLYEDYKGFVENSPIVYAYNINTPLLSWSGKNDTTVDPQQTVSLHMAMRSLKKTHIMLLYPDEGHVLMRQDSQKDLTLKIKTWFDYYLNNKLAPSYLNLD